MYQSDHAHRMDWIETVNKFERLDVKTVIAGHTDPAAPATTPHADRRDPEVHLRL